MDSLAKVIPKCSGRLHSRLLGDVQTHSGRWSSPPRVCSTQTLCISGSQKQFALAVQTQGADLQGKGLAP